MSHIRFSILALLTLLILYSLSRLGLLLYNYELAGDIAVADIVQSFLTGIRFDLRVAIIGCIPLLLSLLSYHAMQARQIHRLWLTLFASVTLFFGIVELDFYREFHQRLNSLVFQYFEEDPGTVLSMIWYGFPVVRLLLLWAVLSWIFGKIFLWLDIRTRVITTNVTAAKSNWRMRIMIFSLCFFVSVVAARGTLRQGPPLRWGDAYITESVFANQLALNGTMTLTSAAKQHFSSSKKRWKSKLSIEEAKQLVRNLLLTPQDVLIDEDEAVIRRQFTPNSDNVLPIKNVVLILMESFSGRYVGALGSDAGITPYFDQLTQRGLLFTRFFSNGTHTHQGMFATMGCFPNIPGYEYLMQQPEGANDFSGLPQLLSKQGFDNLYVYNGDFSWDNQRGFFSNQGMSRFIGRSDYVNPVVADPTWGVADQDMFDRAFIELEKYSSDKPLYALLQTLSNHTPYALPDKLPVKPVTGFGSLDKHLTAMRYSDWALGKFFSKVEKLPLYKDTLFVIVGDHGFGNPVQLTDMDLYRYYVPMLLIAPGIRESFGSRLDVVGTQVDIVPTIVGRLGLEVTHQCWGRDLLDLAPGDKGFGVIKPSGSSQTVAFIADDRILVKPKDEESRGFTYHVGENAMAKRTKDFPDKDVIEKQLDAFISSATQALINNTAGDIKR